MWYVVGFSESSGVLTYVHIDSYDHDTWTGVFGVRDTEDLHMSEVRSGPPRFELREPGSEPRFTMPTMGSSKPRTVSATRV